MVESAVGKLMRDLWAYSTHDTREADLCPGACFSMGDDATRAGLLPLNLRLTGGFAGALMNSVFLQGRLSTVLKESMLNSP